MRIKTISNGSGLKMNIIVDMKAGKFFILYMYGPVISWASREDADHIVLASPAS